MSKRESVDLVKQNMTVALKLAEHAVARQNERAVGGAACVAMGAVIQGYVVAAMGLWGS